MLGAICLFASLFVVIAYLRVKELWEPPGDIIFGVILSEVANSIQITFLSFKRILTNYAFVSPASPTCASASQLYNFSDYLCIGFLLSFYIFYINTLRRSLKSSSIPRFVYHIVPVFFTGTIFLVMSSEDFFGMSAYGLCTGKTLQAPYSLILVLLIFLIVPAYSLWYTNKHLPRNDVMFLKVKLFVEYYRVLVIVSAVFVITDTLSNLVPSMVPQYFYGSYVEIIFFLRTLWIVLRLIHIIVFSYIRFKDPNMKNSLSKIFCCMKAT